MEKVAPKKKALVLTPFYAPNIGGGETFCTELVIELSKKYIVRVATIDWGEQKIFEGLPWGESFRIIFRLLKAARGKRADVIYAQGLTAGFVGVVLKYLWHCKLTITTHALYEFNGLFTHIARWVLSRADVVFTEGNLCERKLNKIGVYNTIRYMHWVDLDKFYPPV